MLLLFLIGPIGMLMLELNSGDIGKCRVSGLDENLRGHFTFSFFSVLDFEVPNEGYVLVREWWSLGSNLDFLTPTLCTFH